MKIARLLAIPAILAAIVSSTSAAVQSWIVQRTAYGAVNLRNVATSFVLDGDAAQGQGCRLYGEDRPLAIGLTA